MQLVRDRRLRAQQTDRECMGSMGMPMNTGIMAMGALQSMRTVRIREAVVTVMMAKNRHRIVKERERTRAGRRSIWRETGR